MINYAILLTLWTLKNYKCARHFVDYWVEGLGNIKVGDILGRKKYFFNLLNIFISVNLSRASFTWQVVRPYQVNNIFELSPKVTEAVKTYKIAYKLVR